MNLKRPERQLTEHSTTKNLVQKRGYGLDECTTVVSFPVWKWVFSTPKHSGRLQSPEPCSLCGDISLHGQGRKMTTHVDLVQRWWMHGT